jgi:hypothetical protein
VVVFVGAEVVDEVEVEVEVDEVMLVTLFTAIGVAVATAPTPVRTGDATESYIQAPVNNLYLVKSTRLYRRRICECLCILGEISETVIYTRQWYVDCA